VGHRGKGQETRSQGKRRSRVCLTSVDNDHDTLLPLFSGRGVRVTAVPAYYDYS